MNKKLKKIFQIIFLIILILAIGTTVFADYRPEDLKGSSAGTGITDVKNVGNQIVGILQAIGVVVSVVVLTILGIKYMLGSIEEKAEYKKSMLPYVIGSALVFSASVVSYIIMTAISF